MDISVSTAAFYKKSFSEVLDIIAKTSCKNLELCINQSVIDYDCTTIQHEVAKRDLVIKSIHTPFYFILSERGETEEYWLQKCLDWSKVFNSKVIVTHTDRMFKGEIAANCDDAHKAVLIKYHKKGLCDITTENMPPSELNGFLSDYELLYEFLAENDLFLTFDTTHFAANNVSIIEAYQRYKNYIKNVHISDFANGAEHKALGTGDLPLSEFILMLKEDNYQVTVTIELDLENPMRNDVKNDIDAISALQNSIDFINTTLV